jgi:PPOX class probable F420-dependent enzyme
MLARMTSTLGIPESHADLLANPNTAVLTTVGTDGLPQSTAVWFLVDDDGVLKTSVLTSRQKCRNLRDNPKATLFVIDPKNPFRTLEVRATVELSPDPGKTLLPKFAARYSTPVEVLDQPGERVAVSFTPRRVVTFG